MAAWGKATANSVVSKIKTKGTLAQEQEDAIRAPLTEDEKAAAKPAAQQVTDVQPKSENTAPADAPHKFTFAEVSDRMNKASDLDALSIAADLIGEVEDPQHRIELKDLFEQRKFALEAA